MARRRKNENGAELLQRILGEVRERLEASRRAVEEHRRLERALEALGAARTRAPESSEPRRPAGRTTGRPGRARAAGGGSSRAQSAANRDRLLNVIGDRPGVTRAELPAATGLSGASVAQGLRRAIAAGRVRERELPGGQTGYALVPAGEPEAAEAGLAPAERADSLGSEAVAVGGAADVTAPDAETPADAATAMAEGEAEGGIAAEGTAASLEGQAGAGGIAAEAAEAGTAGIADGPADAEAGAGGVTSAEAVAGDAEELAPDAGVGPDAGAADAQGVSADETRADAVEPVAQQSAEATAAGGDGDPAPGKPTRRRTTRPAAKRAAAKPRTRRAKGETAPDPAPPAGDDDTATGTDG